MSCNYVVTAYKPTGVTMAVTGNFTGPSDLNLIQAKGNYLVVNQVTPEGLKPMVDVNIYGRITIMQLFRPKVRMLAASNSYPGFLIKTSRHLLIMPTSLMCAVFLTPSSRV